MYLLGSNCFINIQHKKIELLHIDSTILIDINRVKQLFNIEIKLYYSTT